MDVAVLTFLFCRQSEMLRRKERNEAHLYFMVEVYLEEDFHVHQGSDLLDFDEVKPRLLFCHEVYTF